MENKWTLNWTAKVILTIGICFFVRQSVSAQIQQRALPEAWKSLVTGARFRDRFLAMPKGKVVSKVNWGAPGVIGRYVDNGIEDQVRSYWGGKIIYGDDGQFHQFVCGWLESSKKGHQTWPNSIVYHAVSKKSTGPFKIKDTVGPGHNPEVFIAKNGQYAIYVIDGYYLSDSYNGPWKYKKFDFDPRDRPIIEGLSNLTFAKREDGSNLMICRGGGVWFSKTGLSVYQQVSNKRVYPPIDGRFEDPVVWRDNVQYNLIVNDWLGRIAYYLRSKDGINWVTDPGEAYTPGVAFHPDGTKENWFKYERLKILQDKTGRAYQANFAVIDVPKADDKGSDNHSSKNIAIPLNKGMLLKMMNTTFPTSKTKSIRIKVYKEPDFDPAASLDLGSLRFGSNKEVNYGRGSKATKIEKVKDGVIISFENKGLGLTKDEFAPKLIGKDKTGKMVYGYTRVPWINYQPAILSAKKPTTQLDGGKKIVSVQVSNFGLVQSEVAVMELYATINQKTVLVAHQKIPSILPYASTNLKLNIPATLITGQDYPVQLIIQQQGEQKSIFSFTWKME